jgi:hypothetical protein
VAGEDEGPAQLQVVVLNEPRSAAVEVAFPLAIVEDLHGVRWLTTADSSRMACVSTSPPIVLTNLKGRGRRTSHPARRGARKVVYPFTKV